MPFPQVRILEIDRIKFDPAETQARVRIDEESIKDYIEAYRDGAPFPPVICYYDGADYWLADGFHRVLAAREAGFKDIAADVQPGGKSEAKWHAAGANVSHGIRRTNADKRKAVEFALAVHPDYASRAIAKHVGVGHTIVDEIRNQLASDANSTNPIESINKVEKRVGTDGKSYPVKREIPPPPPDPNEPPPEDPTGFQGATYLYPTPNDGKKEIGVVAGNDGEFVVGYIDGNGVTKRINAAGKLPAAPTPGVLQDILDKWAQTHKLEKPSSPPQMDTPPGARMEPPRPPRILDEIGNDVPDRCQALWARRQEAQDILTSISRLRSAVEKARETQDPLWAEINFNCVEAEVNTLYNSMATLKPHAVCAYCGGMTPECRACKGRGLVSRHAFNAYTTRDLRDNAIAAGERNKAARV
jgi:hypothetical protein